MKRLTGNPQLRKILADWPGIRWEVSFSLNGRMAIEASTVKATFLTPGGVVEGPPVHTRITPFEDLRESLEGSCIEAALALRVVPKGWEDVPIPGILPTSR